MDSKTIQSLEEAISLSQQRCSDIQEENKRAAASLESTQNKMLDAQRELGGRLWVRCKTHNDNGILNRDEFLTPFITLNAI